MITAKEVQSLKDAGKFHHATARQQGQYASIYIYVKENNGFNGYDLAGSVSEWPHEIEEFKAVSSILSGVHVGSYGRG